MAQRVPSLCAASLLAGLLAGAAQAQAQPVVYPTPQSGAGCLSSQLLLHMNCSQLEAIYANGSAPAIPCGKVRGRVIPRPGTALTVPASRVGHLVWQGKVFRPECGMVVNRFFGVRMIRANLAYGPSWRDGQPTLVLDYSQTSLVYARYRDEIRQVAPGLYLGLMFDTREPTPTVTTYFLLETGAAG